MSNRATWTWVGWEWSLWLTPKTVYKQGRHSRGMSASKITQRLTRHRQGQFHPRENDNPVLLRNWVSVGARFPRSSRLDVSEVADVVVVGDCHRAQSLFSARGDKLLCIACPIFLRFRALPAPVAVPWAVNLKVAAVKVGALVHVCRLSDAEVSALSLTAAKVGEPRDFARSARAAVQQ